MFLSKPSISICETTAILEILTWHGKTPFKMLLLMACKNGTTNSPILLIYVEYYQNFLLYWDFEHFLVL